MALLVLAYPQIAETDFVWIQNYRKIHDKLFYSMVGPHFTIVFPVFDLSKETFVAEIRERIREVDSIDFALRCATINKDAFSDYFHTFLVPDEGYSRIVKLHDQLYSGRLAEHLHLDIDFIPHIGIGNAPDKYECKKEVDEWNRKDFTIKGRIEELTIVSHEKNTIEMVEVIKLN